MRLEGKVALVTGATGGMGSASARLSAKEGAAVLVAARHQELAGPVVQEITDAGGKASFVSLEVTEQHQWEAAVHQAKEQYGGAQRINFPFMPRGTERLRIVPSPLHSPSAVRCFVGDVDQAWAEFELPRAPDSALGTWSESAAGAVRQAVSG